jgi:hypothetical protein
MIYDELDIKGQRRSITVVQFDPNERLTLSMPLAEPTKPTQEAGRHGRTRTRWKETLLMHTQYPIQTCIYMYNIVVHTSIQSYKKDACLVVYAECLMKRPPPSPLPSPRSPVYCTRRRHRHDRRASM